MKYSELPLNVKEICDDLVPGLQAILGDRLYGIYLYGATMFPESGPAMDIDAHVVLNASLNDEDRSKIHILYEDIAGKHPPLGGELDIWYILMADARKTEPPGNQLKTEMYDKSWALHCAHVRAGRYLTLFGPEPADIFPAPSWEAVEASLDHEIDFVKQALQYPDYCVLNLCRIMYSFRYRDVVVSKRFSGRWAADTFPQWKDLIDAAGHAYDGTVTPGETELLRTELQHFLDFSLERISEARREGDRRDDGDGHPGK